MTAGRREYFWKETFAKFTRKPLKQSKTRSSTARRSQPLEPRHCSMALCEAASAPPAPGPSSALRRPPVVLWGRRKSGKTAAGADHGCWPGPGGTVPVTVATPCLRAQWLPLCCPTVFAWATHCGPLPTAVTLSTPLTRSALALVFRGRADKEARAS